MWCWFTQTNNAKNTHGIWRNNSLNCTWYKGVVTPCKPGKKTKSQVKSLQPRYHGGTISEPTGNRCSAFGFANWCTKSHDWETCLEYDLDSEFTFTATWPWHIYIYRSIHIYMHLYVYTYILYTHRYQFISIHTGVYEINAHPWTTPRPPDPQTQCWRTLMWRWWNLACKINAHFCKTEPWLVCNIDVWVLKVTIMY